MYLFSELHLNKEGETARTTNSVPRPLLSKSVVNDICLKGIQTTEVDTTDNTFDLRLVALIRGNQYTSAGFTATISYTDAEGNPHTVENVDLATTNAYLGLNAEGVPNAIKTAPGFYLIAVCITGIPADAKDLTVTFNAYANPIGANAPITTKTAVFSYGATA